MDEKNVISSRYLLWETNGEKFVTANDRLLLGKYQYYRLHEPEPLTHDFPEDAKLVMTNVGSKPRFPDVVSNTHRLLILSDRLRQFLIGKKIPNVEFLPIEAIDTERRSIGLTYYLLHSVGAPRCLDWEASEAKSRYSEGDAEDMKTIRLAKDPQLPIFRPADLSKFIFVERSLAEEIHNAGFTGDVFYEVEYYPSYKHDQPFPKIKELVALKASDAYLQQKAAKKNKRLKKPPKEFQDSLAQFPIPKGADTLHPPYQLNGDGFFPVWGFDWLEEADFSAEDWPDFDRKRWFAVGFNGHGNVWLFDLDSARIAEYSHERDFDETNFRPVFDSWQSFTAAIKPHSPRAE